MVRKTKHGYVMHRYFGVLEKCRQLVDEGCVKKVVFLEDDLNQRNARQLDPKLVTLTYLLENNMIVSPKDFVHAFNITDPADLEAHNDIQNVKALEYLEAHKDELKALVTPVVESSKEK